MCIFEMMLKKKKARKKDISNELIKKNEIMIGQCWSNVENKSSEQYSNSNSNTIFVQSTLVQILIAPNDYSAIIVCCIICMCADFIDGEMRVPVEHKSTKLFKLFFDFALFIWGWASWVICITLIHTLHSVEWVYFKYEITIINGYVRI